jgi:hypothetical protein
MQRHPVFSQSLAASVLPLLFAANTLAQQAPTSPASQAPNSADPRPEGLRESKPGAGNIEVKPESAAVPSSAVDSVPSQQDSPNSAGQQPPAGANQPVAPTATPQAPQNEPAKAPPGPAPLESPPVIKAKWETKLYGFLILDTARDSTQSYQHGAPGYGTIAKPGTWAGDHGRTTFDARFTRIGFRLAAPEVEGIKASAFIEFDFGGNQAIAYPNTASYVSESGAYGNPIPRLLNFMGKAETPYVDVSAGLYYHLFAFGPYFLPLSAQISPVVGTALTRTTQVRVGKSFKTDDVTVELTLAADRPPARDGQYPDGEAGIRFLVNNWKGIIGFGGTGAYDEAGGIGISGIYRKIRLPDFNSAPTGQHGQTGKGLSLNALIPVIPRTAKSKGNALTVLGAFSTGTGIGDLYALTGGAYFPALPNPTGATPAPTYAQDIDNGLVTYDPQGRLQTINWKTYFAGAQYYLPPSGRVWLGTNYGYVNSTNLGNLGLAPTRIIPKETFWNAVAFYEITPKAPAITALEYSELKQTYGDGVTAKNKRVQLSFYYSFY